MSEQVFTPSGLDALPPPAMARRAEEIGEAKAKFPTLTIFALSVLAGAFIALGAIFATTVMSNGDTFPYGVNRLLGGITFSLGLILVVVAGAELFTGNNLIVMASGHQDRVHDYQRKLAEAAFTLRVPLGVPVDHRLGSRGEGRPRREPDH